MAEIWAGKLAVLLMFMSFITGLTFDGDVWSWIGITLLLCVAIYGSKKLGVVLLFLDRVANRAKERK